MSAEENRDARVHDAEDRDDWDDDWDGGDEESESFPRMSFLDHLDELRARLFRIVLMILVSIVITFNFVDPLWKVLEGPAVQMLADAQEKSLSLTREARNLVIEIEALPALPPELDKPDLQRFRGFVNDHLKAVSERLSEQIKGLLVAKDAKLMQTAIGEAFFLKVKISFMAGLVLCYPFLIYQIWAFVAPGLYRRERSVAVPFIVFATLFFIGGLIFGYYIAVPLAGRFLMSWGAEFVQLITIDKYMDFLVTMMLGLGIVFEIPMVIFLLSKMGIATPRWLVRNFRYAVLLIVIVAAIVTPTGDPVNLAIFSLPMIALYWLGVVVAWVWGPKRRPEDEEDEEDDDEEEEDDDEEGEDEEGEDIDGEEKSGGDEAGGNRAVKDPYAEFFGENPEEHGRTVEPPQPESPPQPPESGEEPGDSRPPGEGADKAD